MESHEVARLLRCVVNDLAPDVVALDFNESGRVVWTSTDPVHEMPDPETYYPSVAEYQLPPSEPPLPVVTRAQLTVVARLSYGVDKVSYGDDDSKKMAVFKYNPFVTAVGGNAWGEIQILARLPRNHPNILTLDALVVEELTGHGVVGFTTRFVTAPTLDRQWSFKLGWLRQLMSLVDQLHLHYDVHHQDLADRNVFVHPDNPDEILLFDFNYATPAAEADPARDDVKGVIAMVYTLITRHPKYKLYFLPAVDEQRVLRGAPESWVKHPRVELDADVSVFYAELMEWVRKRRSSNPSETTPPCAIHRPLAPTPPSDVAILDDGREAELIGGQASARDRIRAGRPVLNWRRPPTLKLDPSRRMLATGRYADEQEEYDRSRPDIAVPDPSRGFPQPLVVASPQEPAPSGKGKRKVLKRKRSGVRKTGRRPRKTKRRKTRTRDKVTKKAGENGVVGSQTSSF
ncbi:hypothetical protein B0T25DRAFT_503515 [Lasiosphaeria hispida]|uniref:Protein kinase domain-containing protein n=1 Tax=Lasiosphaeria hispida TaxID=260671 RepID=A0AAJ0MBM4_9PEZI|nr:hypothetical protein B0T25DRAFT_503515 [Lasiosphaeria hispida]